MALTDITGVFSRYFVVGFFMPAYVSLVSLWLAASSEFIPDELERHSEATQLLILGGVALVAGLTLSGVSYYVTRLFEGYPLERASAWPVLGWLHKAVLTLQLRRFHRLLAIRDDQNSPPKDRQRAARTLDRFFPHRPEALLPTRVGNAIRAFEWHSNVRWGLDGVTIWPRIEALLTAEQRELQVDAKINFYVFINAALGGLVVGACLVIDAAINGSPSAAGWLLYLIPFLSSYVLYRASIGPATDWGDNVRASVDLHRLEVYEKLGVRAPTSFTDERKLAVRVNQALLYGHPLLSDDLWRQNEDEEPDETAEGGLLTCLKNCLTKGE